MYLLQICLYTCLRPREEKASFSTLNGLRAKNEFPFAITYIDNHVFHTIYFSYMDHSHEPTMKDVMQAVSSLTETVSAMKEDLEFVKENAVTKDELRETKQELLDQTISKDYFFEHALTKKHFHEHAVTKDELREAKNDIVNSIDGFIKLHEKLDLELTALRSKYTRLESHIQQIAKHMNIELV